jgi:catechol 2,3-dioxygenase-like lactoylglutathione lyase family enzyme
MYVRDQDDSKAFYADRLGFEVLRDEEMFPGARWLELRPPGGRRRSC